MSAVATSDIACVESATPVFDLALYYLVYSSSVCRKSTLVPTADHYGSQDIPLHQTSAIGTRVVYETYDEYGTVCSPVLTFLLEANRDRVVVGSLGWMPTNGGIQGSQLLS
jgi:hypothetical protein